MCDRLTTTPDTHRSEQRRLHGLRSKTIAETPTPYDPWYKDTYRPLNPPFFRDLKRPARRGDACSRVEHLPSWRHRIFPQLRREERRWANDDRSVCGTTVTTTLKMARSSLSSRPSRAAHVHAHAWANEALIRGKHVACVYHVYSMGLLSREGVVFLSCTTETIRIGSSIPF